MKKKSISIKLKSIDIKILLFYKVFIIDILNTLNISYKTVNIPKKVKKMTLLKSPHVCKRAKEHFQLVTHKTLIIINSFLSTQILTSLLYNKPKGLKLVINV